MPDVKPLLLVRPKMCSDEGLPEYVQRLARANGIPKVSMLLSHLGITLNEIIMGGAEKFLRIVSGRASPADLKSRYGRRIKNHPIELQKQWIHNRARVCPMCLKESDVLSAEWSQPLSIVCRKHHCLLLHSCPECGRKIDRRASQYQCHCGYLFEESTQPVAPLWIEAYDDLCQFSENQLSDMNPCHRRRSELLTAKAIRLTCLLKADQPETQYRDRHRRMSHWIDSADLDFLSELLSPSEEKLVAFLADGSPPNYQRISAELLANEDLCAGFKKVVSEAKLLSRQSRQAKHIEAIKIRSKSACSVLNIARLLSINPQTARRLYDDRRFYTLIIGTWGTGSKPSFIEALKYFVASTTPLEKIAGAYGLGIGETKYLLDQLGFSGVPITHCKKQIRYRNSDIEMALGGLQIKNALPPTPGLQVIRLSDLKTHIQSPAYNFSVIKAKVLSAVIKGLVPYFSDSKEPRSIGDLLVTYDVMIEHFGYPSLRKRLAPIVFVAA